MTLEEIEALKIAIEALEFYEQGAPTYEYIVDGHPYEVNESGCGCCSGIRKLNRNLGYKYPPEAPYYPDVKYTGLKAREAMIKIKELIK